jgi:two-component system sensor histidine kinase GlrK
MNLPGPRSLNGRLLLGMAVIAAPLLAALVTAVLQLRQLSGSGERLVVEGLRATRQAQELRAGVGALERRARYAKVLGDRALLEAYRADDARLQDIERQLQDALRTPGARNALASHAALREGIALRLLEPGADATMRDVAIGDFARLGELGDELARAVNAQIDTELAALRAGTRRTQQQLFWDVALLVPLTALALLAFSLSLGRPLRRIDKAIADLGRGDLLDPIRIEGPVDLEKLGQQLEWLRRRLLGITEERNRFLRHMSHELKTPLANIREGTELLMDGTVGGLAAEQREVMGILRENSLNLQRLIENLLSYSAWQSSKVGLELSAFRLRGLLRQVIESQQLSLLGRRVNLDAQIEDCELVADRAKLRLILDNLLSNAIKYSPSGGHILLRAAVEGSELVLDVADTGPGIPPEDRAHVFDAFFTGQAPQGHVRGTGIGLSVVLEFVTLHGGHITIVDGERPGAHFRIRLPLRNETNRP